jgi:GNAT superfamily N-acetyltransferase
LTNKGRQEIDIRAYENRFLPDIEAICYRTGYMGGDLTGTGAFNDRGLFGTIFCRYYPLFEPENCFVAVSGERALGYIMGTMDTRAQEQRFFRAMYPRIALRLPVAFIRYRESFRVVMRLPAMARAAAMDDRLLDAYPAHLHINLLPEARGLGVGRELLSRFEGHAASRGAAGVHLWTTDRNARAVVFYRENGYRLIREVEGVFWPGVPGARGLMFAKSL